MPEPDNDRPNPSDLPEGTVTFLFTDIEGSTELLKALGAQYTRLLEDERRIVRAFAEKFGGQEVDTQGDSFFISFPRATQAVSAAVEIQRKMQNHTWPEGVEVRLRMGLHTGEPLTWAEGYVGIDVHRAARIAAVGYGGQVLLSETTTALIRDDLPEGVSLLDLGHHRLKDLPQPELICQLEIEGMQSAFPPLKSEDAGLPHHNLPAQLTAFIGRTLELEALEAIIADPEVRLITIVAPGGMGKTRLALALAAKQVAIRERTNGKLRARFPNGVFFVPLAPLTSPGSILPAIAEALNFQIVSSEGRSAGAGGETRSAKKQVLDYLRPKRLLLVMDNFEHLLDGVGLVNEVIASAPEVKVLVTSRERLNVKAEHLFPLAGMKVPEVDASKKNSDIEYQTYSALALFLESAQRSKPEFTIVDENLEDIVKVCRLLGGMPLGIELAASWLNALTVREIAVEIQRSLDFLETRLRDVDERHRSIRAVFDGTWERLSEAEQDLYKKLTVFQGGFIREAAVEVAGASLEILINLTNRTLLQFDPSSGHYEIHALLRQFGAEKLAQDGEKESTVRDRHSAYFCEQLRTLEAALKGAHHPEAMKAIEIDHENIFAAWSRAADRGDIPALAQTLDALDLYFESSGRIEEAEQFFRTIANRVSRADSVEALRLEVRLNTRVVKSLPSKRLDQARHIIGENWDRLKSPLLSSADIRSERAELLTQEGEWILDPYKSLNYYRDAFMLFEELDDRWNMAFLLERISSTNQAVADRKVAIKQAEESLAIFRELGYGKGITRCLDRISALMIHRMEFEDAEKCIRESLDISAVMNDRRMLGWTLLFLGYLKLWQGYFKEANNVFNEAIGVNEELGQSFNSVYANIESASADNHLGMYQSAHARALKAQRESEREGFAMWKIMALGKQGEARMGEGNFKSAGLLLQESIEREREQGYRSYLPIILTEFGICMYGLGNYVGMRDVILEGLQISLEIDRPTGFLYGFPALALLRLHEGNAEEAITYYSFAASHRYVADSKWFQAVAGKHIEEAASALPHELVEAARERGRNLDPYEVTAEILNQAGEKDSPTRHYEL